MNRDSDVEDSQSIHKCQKSILYTLIDNVMLTEHKRWNPEMQKCSARTVDGVHTTKNMGCVLNVCTQKNSCMEQSEAFVHAERLEKSMETAVGC